MEATQGQINCFFNQLPYKCHLEEVAFVGDWLKICPQLDSRVGRVDQTLATLSSKSPRPIGNTRRITIFSTALNMYHTDSGELHHKSKT